MSADFSEKQKSGIEQVFNKYDANGDGELTPEELQMAMRDMKVNASLVAAQRLIQEYDTDNSGTLTFDEFKVMLTKRAKIQHAFKQLDTDGSGYISKEEMKQHVNKMQLDLDDAEIEDMIAEIDTDCDGKIDLKEFTRFLSYLKEQEQA